MDDFYFQFYVLKDFYVVDERKSDVFQFGVQQMYFVMLVKVQFQ